MPCDSSHLEPRFKEKESREVAKHIKRLCRLVGVKCPAIAKDAAKEYYGNESACDELTAMLCGLMGEHEQAVLKRLANSSAKDAELWSWWVSHKKADKRKGQ